MKTSRLRSFSSDSPSFGSFSSAVDLAATAARVVNEFRDQDPESASLHVDDDDFEFAFDCSSHRYLHPVATADEIFSDGQIRPLIPYVGNSAVDVERESQRTPSPPKNSTLPRPRRPALRKLMSEEERDPTSNYSSEAEEDLTGVPPETYCVWTPKKSNGGDDDRQRLSSSPSRNSKIKSNSEGSSKRWKLRNLLYARSVSEGNEKLVFPASVKAVHDQREEEKSAAKEQEREREEMKRQPFVPYQKDLIGILKNVNGLSCHLRPF